MMLNSFIDLLFPPLCHSCRKFVPNASTVHICPECLDSSRPIEPPICPTCGIPFATDGGISHRCGSCMAAPPWFDSARGAFLFEGAVKELIHRLKYDGRVQCRRPLGLLLAERLRAFAAEASPELLVPVPLHAKRIRQRGFNQAILIGEVLSREWRIPLERRLLLRNRWTEPQVSLSAGERAANVRGAFGIADPTGVEGRRIMLVDDVLTTGSTVNECARVLKKCGASVVSVVTVARVPNDTL